MNANSLHYDTPVENDGGSDRQNDQGNDQQQAETPASEAAGHHDEDEDDAGQEDDDDHHHDDQAYEQALAAAVAAANWNDLVKRLIAYSSFRLLRFTSARRSGLGPDDFADEAITLVLNKTRRLNFEGDATLFSQLCSICDSLISHQAEKARRRINGGMAEVPIVTEADGDAPDDRVTEEHLGAPATFEPELIARDRFECFARSLEPRLAAYVRLRVTGSYATAEEYANALSTTVQEIRNLDRQLWRRRNLYDSGDSRQVLRGKSRAKTDQYALPIGA
jgi:hypothetical protein